MNQLDYSEWQVLLVDDDDDDYLIVKLMLSEAQGRKIALDWAGSYQAGQEKLGAGPYDAVLVDYDLGDKTGIALIREFSDRGYPAPFLLYTGRGSYAVDVEAMQAGATLYLTKAEANPLLLERVLRYAIERKRIENDRELALARVEDERRRLEAVMEALPVGVEITDDRGGSLRDNQAYERLWGRPLPEVKDVEDYAAYHAWWVETGEALAPHDWASARAVERGETVVGQLLEIQRFDGTRAFVHNSAAPIRNSHGEIVGSVVAVQDITALRQAEQALRESEQRFALLFQKAAFPATLSRLPDGVLMDVNQAWVEMAGYSRAEALGKTTLELGINPDAEGRARIWRSFKPAESVRQMETTLRTRAGEQRTLLVNIEVVELGGQKYLINTSQDITESKRAHESLQEAYEQLQEQATELEVQAEELLVQTEELDAANRVLSDHEAGLLKMIDHTPASIAYIDENLRYAWANRGYELWYGFVPGQIKGKLVYRVMGQAIFEAVQPSIERALTGEQARYDLTVSRVDGGRRRLQATLTPDRGADGRVRGYVEHVMDEGS